MNRRRIILYTVYDARIKCVSFHRQLNYSKRIEHSIGNLNVVNSTLDIPFPSEREAECAFHVLRVDSEPSRSSVTKNLTHDQKLLKVSFLGTDPRKVRVAVSSFFESLILVVNTMKQYGPPKPSYNHF